MSYVIEPWRLDEIASAIGGELVNGKPDQTIHGVTTDSRSIPPRSLFVALKGEKHDAHAFIPAISGAGARGAIVDHLLPTRLDFALVRVSDTTLALGDLACAYRKRFRPVVAAVTGTSGKTTTKNFLAAVCRRHFRTLATEGNLNNHIGVPLTLFGMNRKTEKAVIEMGMSDRGEIARLCAIAEPSIGVITSIGPCHLDQLKNVQGVIEAKSELIEHLNRTNGTVILDVDQPYFEELRSRVTCRLISVGESAEADVKIRVVSVGGSQPASFVFRGIEVSLKLHGRHAISNAALAAAAAEAMGVDTLDIIEGLSSTYPADGRSRRHQLDGAILIDDAYNANPLSYSAALATLAEMTASRRIVVMADMLELGEETALHHARVGEMMARAGIDLLIWRGEMTSHAAAAATGVKQIACTTNEEMAAALKSAVRPGDAVLIKASHGMRLDHVVAMAMTAMDSPRSGALVALKR